MRRIIALVIIGLVIAIAITKLQEKKARSQQTEAQPPVNYFQCLEECGETCIPLAAILVVVTQ